MAILSNPPAAAMQGGAQSMPEAEKQTMIEPARTSGMSSMASRIPLRDILLLLLATFVLRGLFLGNPHMDVDEQFYLLTGGRMLDGAVPFVDIWDRKPVGLFLIYAFASLFGNGVLAYEILAMLCVGATAIVLYAMARTYADRSTALMAGAGYAVLVNFLDGAGGQSPVYYNLLIALAAFVVQRQLVTSRTRRAALVGAGVLAMALCGLAIQVKYLVIGEGLFLGLMLLWLAWRRFGAFTAFWSGALWVVGALLPTVAVVACYALIGDLDALLFANFHSIFLRPEDSLDQVVDRLLDIATIIAVPTAIGIAGLRMNRSILPTEEQRISRRFALGWTAAAWLAFLVFGTYFRHYALPLAGPTMLLFACASGRWRRFRASVLVAGALWSVYSAQGTAGREVDTASLDRIVVAMGDTRNCPFVFRGPSITYHLGDFCLPTAYVFPYFLNHMRENPTLGVQPDKELARIIATRPDYILIRWPMYDYSRVSLDILLPVLCSDYRPVLNEVQWRDEALVLYHLRPGVQPRPNDIGAGGHVGNGRGGRATMPGGDGVPGRPGTLPVCPWHAAGTEGVSILPR